MFYFGKNFWYGFVIALGVTIVSLIGYFFPVVGSVAGVVLVVGALVLAWKHPLACAVFTMLEWIIGFEGHLFEIHGVAIRTILFFILWIAGGVFFVRAPSQTVHAVRRSWIGAVRIKNVWPFIVIAALACAGAIVGVRSHHTFAAVRGELVGYAFYLAVIPLGVMWNGLWTQRVKIFGLFAGACVGVAVVTLAVFLLFSWRTLAIHANVYRWWRDVVFGKITDTGTDFFRVTAATHLWYIVALCVTVWGWIKKNISARLGATLCAFFVSALIINFSRAYLLGLCAGLAILFCADRSRRACALIGIVGVMFVGEFFALNLLASHGHSLGLELFATRTHALADPESEISTRLRAEILPSVRAAVENHPWRGSGLGTALTFWSASAHKNVTTTSFDWGFLQTWIQLGVLGLVALLYLLGALCVRGSPPITSSVVALAVTHLFGPTFFHPVGVVALVLLWCVCYGTPHEI